MAQYQQDLAPLMAMDEARAIALVPKVNGLLFSPCPNCNSGSHETDLKWNGIEDPDHVHCGSCKMVFPNEQYPLNKQETVPDRSGKAHTWRWHEMPNGNRTYYLARARFDAKDYLGKAVFDLAAAYRLSGDQAYARRAAVLLYALAEAYPAWNVMHDYPKPGGKYPVKNAKPPYTTWNGVWARWWYYEIPTPLIHAYDLLYDSGVFETLAIERGMTISAIRGTIENKFFRSAIDFVLTYKEIYTNASPPIYIGLIAAGRVMGDPVLVHEGVDRAATLYRTQFYADGIWNEGAISYHWMTLNYMQRVLAYAEGYSDPAKYIPAKNMRPFANLSMSTQFPIISRAQTAPLQLVWPNGRAVAVHDSWPKETYPNTHSHGPMLLSHYGHARLTAPQANGGELQTHLHFSGASGHAHADNLSLILYSHGEEMLPDIGYTWTLWRFWAASTMSHNTVSVDHKEIRPDRRSGVVTLLSQRPGEMQVIEVSQPWSFDTHMQDYRRRLTLVPVDDDDAYVIDVFNVTGGRYHDYFLHGHAERPQEAKVSLALSSIPGTLLGDGVTYRLPRSHSDRGETANGYPVAYAMIRQLQGATTNEAFRVDWQFKDQTTPALRTHVLGQTNTRIVLGQSPQIRPVGEQFKESEEKLDDYWRPTLVLRREGASTLKSRFVVIHEPLGNEPLIERVEVSQESPLVIKVVRRGGVDWVLCDTLGEDQTLQINGLPITARAALVRQTGNQPTSVSTIASPHALRAKVLRTIRDDTQALYGIETSLHYSSTDQLAGQAARIIVSDGTGQAFIIRKAEATSAGTMLWLDSDPGFNCTAPGVEYSFYPVRTIPGQARVEIDRFQTLAP